MIKIKEYLLGINIAKLRMLGLDYLFPNKGKVIEFLLEFVSFFNKYSAVGAMQKLFSSLVVSVLFISTTMAQLSTNVEDAQRYRVNTQTTVFESSNSTNLVNESATNSGMILNKSNSQLEELGARYIFVRSNSQIDELGARYIFVRSNSQIDELGARYIFVRSNSQLEELGARYIFVRSNSQIDELGARYIFVRSNSQIDELGARYIFVRSNSQIDELGARYIFVR
ncbi:MAG: hypothetical protein R6W68_17075 [Ignavibacteriaceae bacterium]